MSEEKNRLKFKAMKCATCAAPVYYDTSKNGFFCLYCRNLMPYEGDDGVEETSFHLDHIPVTIENECYRLKHLGDSRDMSHGKGWKADKNWQYIAKQKFLDHQKRQSYSTRELLIHSCPMCGAQVEAFASQNIWHCDYCRNKFIKDEILQSKDYKSYEVIDNGDKLLPHFAIPFSVSREEAKRIILRFAALRPNSFKEQNLEKRVDELWQFYVPFRISDSSFLVEVETEKGTALLLQDCINLVTPITNDHNQHMLNDIGPWDLSAIAPFSAKFAEGDIGFDETYEADSSPALFIRENTLKPEIVAAIKKLYPSKNYRINWIREELRTVKTVMLPIYFLDKMNNGIKVYFMVNGQTGAVCALGRGQMEGRETLFAPGNADTNSFRETTLKSGWQPVIEQEPQIYKRVSADEAFRKKGLLKRLFDINKF